MDKRYYSTGEVAERLLIPVWRVQKFIDSPRFGFKLAQSWKGPGKGFRRVFLKDDAIRLYLLDHLTSCGLSTKAVAAILKQIPQPQKHKETYLTIDLASATFPTTFAYVIGPMPKINTLILNWIGMLCEVELFLKRRE
jgi:hypothetical protein